MTRTLLSIPLGNWGQPSFELLADSSAVLVVLAAAFLVFRTFRETYLLTWILGWACYLVYRVTTGAAGMADSGAWPRAVAHLAFVAAVALFAATLLFYTHRRRAFLPLGILTFIATAVALTRALWLPDAPVIGWAFRLLCTLMALFGGVQLAWFSRGRRQLGAWIAIIALLLLHFHDPNPAPFHELAGGDIVIELFLGLGMLVIVLEDSRTRNDRLAAVTAVTSVIGQAREHGELVLTALEQMKNLLSARAVWFRSLKDNQLLITQQIGVSENLLRHHALLDLGDSEAGRIVREARPAVLRTDSASTPNAKVLRAEGFQHLLIVPVKGKTAIVGAVCLAQSRQRDYSADELDFLMVVANQIGIAMENLDLLQQIMRSHRQWVRTVDAIEDSILVHDEQFRLLRINRALLQRLTLEDYGEIVLRSCEEILPGGKQRWRDCPYCASGAEFIEGPDPAFGGFSIVTSSMFTDEGGRLTGTIHIIRDTTDRRAAEEKYRLLFEQAQEGVFVSTPGGRLEDCNDAFVRMLGYDSREQVLALDVAGSVYARPGTRESFLAAMEQHGFVRNFEVELRRQDGSVISALENSFAERDASGKIVRYQGFLLDISEIKRAQDEIRRRNRELHALNAIAVVGAQSFDLHEIVNNALRQVVTLFGTDTGGVWLLDGAGDGMLHRHAAHGHRREWPDTPVAPGFVEALRRQPREIITERDLSRLPGFAQTFLEAEGLVACAWVIMWSKDQPVGVLGVGNRSPRQFSATDLSLLVAIGRQLATTIEKVRLYQETRRAYHDLQRTQEQLLQSEKMSAIGQLVSGVAHELNNPLTAILGYAELLQSEHLPERALDFAGKLVKQAQRTQRLVQNLLSFSRQRKPEKKLVDVRRVLEDTIALRDYDFKRLNIVVNWQFDPDLPPVLGDGHQIEQVFLNIINNAADAMLDPPDPGNETGRLNLAEVDKALATFAAKAPEASSSPTRPGSGAVHRLEVSLRRQNGSICAEFHDSGPGIREPKKVFDPFYTTKRVGKGTGLGLSICYGIVKEHGGEIFASNAPQGGAVFRVVLPVAQQPAGEAAVQTPERMPGPALRGRVLVVHQEEPVREVICGALTKAGPEVVTLATGEEALARLQGEQFDAVLLDLEIPGALSPARVYDWLAENRPGAEKNIIFAVSNISQVEPRLAESAVCLIKPLQVSELVAAVQLVLSRRSAAAAG